MSHAPDPTTQSPIICSPFDEPGQHWKWSDMRVLETVPLRRPGGYYYRTEEQMDLFGDPGYVPLTLVNLLREDVRRWRESGYRGATQTTKALFDHWFAKPRERRFFFCQREAVETVVYLMEMRLPGRSLSTGFRNFELSDDDLHAMLNGERPSFHDKSNEIVPSLIDPSPDYALNLLRLGCKMATGSGKTVVMALLLAWAFCNRAKNPQSVTFPNAALIVAPNLTVKERLQVLRPDIAGNFFEQFDIVPQHLHEAMGTGRVLVLNWHVFAPASPHEESGGTYRVVEKGPETLDDFARRVLGDLYERMPILVLNDEGHHCWRPAPNDSQRHDDERIAVTGSLKDEQEEARRWLEGLDKINNAHRNGGGVSICLDLSATPFYIAGSGHTEGRPFPWLVSDFGLTDAIESGIVKVPRVPVQSNSGQPEPEYFHLWKHIHKGAAASDRQSGSKKLKPEVIYRKAEGALQQLAGQWKSTFDKMREVQPDSALPPVMIIVCDNTDLARLFYEHISGEREEEAPVTEGEVAQATEGEGARPKKKAKKLARRTVYGPSDVMPELANTATEKRTIRIDSKMLAEAESDDTTKKSDAAELLRRVVATVGRRGEPGENVRCVVSVSMLTEGWDANSVTHILGVRAFGSQLLCEQVVGRGLRRISYDIDPETNQFRPEYADVYGIPFSVVPFKGKATGGTPPEPQVLTSVKALPQRAAFEMRFPNVEGYGFGLKYFRLQCDIGSMEELHLEPHREPTQTFVAPTIAESSASGTTPFGWETQSRTGFYEANHLQTIKFRIAQMLLHDLLTSRGESDAKQRVLRLQARHLLFPQVFAFVDAYIGTPELKRAGKVHFHGQDAREIGLQTYVERIVGRLRDAIHPDEKAGEAPILPLLNRFKPVGSTRDVNFVTSRPVKQTQKSHISGVVSDTRAWEQAAAFALEASSRVLCYARNDRLGLRIPYSYLSTEHFYEPDFLARLDNGTPDGLQVLVEIKGAIDDQDRAKHDAANRWLAAVNHWDGCGKWHPQIVVCRDPQDLSTQLSTLLAS